MREVEWPDYWQKDAQAALTDHFGTDDRIRIIVGDPQVSIDGSVLEGFVYLEENVPMIIDDRSGRPDVHPWPLLRGPVLRIYQLRRRRPPTTIFAHSDWTPRHKY